MLLKNMTTETRSICLHHIWDYSAHLRSLSCITLIQLFHVLQDLHPEYTLFGSIVHSGFSPESGHYYAYIKVSLFMFFFFAYVH